MTTGQRWYPILVLQRFSDIEIIIDRDLIINLEILSINKHDRDLIQRPYEEHFNPVHIIVKMNEFGPLLMYHRKCHCGLSCSFYGSNDICDYSQYLIKNIGVACAHPSIMMSKIVGICKRIIFLSGTELITDLVVYVGIIMLNIV